MADIRIDVAKVCGHCNAALENGDSFLLRGTSITPQGHWKSCQIALASVVMNAGRLRISESPIYIACPDPGTGEGGNVTFRLSFVDDHEYDQDQTG